MIDDTEEIRCWRCGAGIDDCCCDEQSPITLTAAIDILNELHLQGLLDKFSDLYPNAVEELDFDGGC